MNNAIRFVRGWMGRPVGSIDRADLGYGQKLALVTRGVAKWVTEAEQESKTQLRRTKRTQREN